MTLEEEEQEKKKNKRRGTRTWAELKAKHVRKWKEAEAKSGKPAWLRTLSDYDRPRR